MAIINSLFLSVYPPCCVWEVGSAMHYSSPCPFCHWQSWALSRGVQNSLDLQSITLGLTLDTMGYDDQVSEDAHVNRIGWWDILYLVRLSGPFWTPDSRGSSLFHTETTCFRNQYAALQNYGFCKNLHCVKRFDRLEVNLLQFPLPDFSTHHLHFDWQH